MKLYLFVCFFAGFTFMPALFASHWAVRSQKLRPLLICLLFMAGGLAIEIFLVAHYLAAGTAALYAFGLQSMRYLRRWKSQGLPVGLALSRYMVALCVLLALLRAVAQPLHLAPPEWPAGNWNWSWIGPGHWGTERARVLEQLSRLPGRQLAIVRYDNTIHQPIDEWVYNGADIDESKVVWARDLGEAENRKLAEYYKDRTVWMVQPDKVPAPAEPYLQAGTPESATRSDK